MTGISPSIMEPRLPALGFVKIGRQRVEGDRGYRPDAKGKQPTKLDHFRVTSTERGPDGNYLLDEAVHSVVGKEPTELDVRLPFDRRRENLHTEMVRYHGQTRTHECDGEKVLDLSTGKTVVCTRRSGRRCACKPWARLGVILEAAPEFGGVYAYQTTSWQAIAGMQTALDMFESQFGSLRGLPLRMRLQKGDTRYMGSDNKIHTGTAWRVALVLRASYDEARAAALEYHRTHQVARSEILQLAAGTAAGLEELEREHAGALTAEFFPDREAKDDEDHAEPRGGRVGELNRQIAASGEDAQGPPDDEEEVEPGDLGAVVAKVKAELRRVAGVVGKDEEKRIRKAIADRDEERLRIALDWLAGFGDP